MFRSSYHTRVMVSVENDNAIIVEPEHQVHFIKCLELPTIPVSWCQKRTMRQSLYSLNIRYINMFTCADSDRGTGGLYPSE